jgi:hypothetical protein
MIARFRPRFTYANVMATVAVFLALGGGAYALSGIPDRSGVYHGCVAASGALRVVKSASACRKAKTVKRGKRRVRIPGESAIAWNQQGRPGLTGVQGVQGVQGVRGPLGPPGPTFASARVGMTPTDPPASPDESSSAANTEGRSYSFTLPAAGNVYVRYFSRAIGRDCTAGFPRAGLYLDGSPVPRTDAPLNSATSPLAGDFVGVTPAIAGAHVVEVREDCAGAGSLGAGSEDPLGGTWTVQLAGG